ncbi:BatD family protein [Paracrocinitomix mangrovi]|uniref:BatD family protein n=1 Tax=Paracrocinitomix mangrovi TaxID=2862509 RepID=UPI001C8EDFAA|nr:BatD family protein [Paracrocinitomix mangrovi]UKN01310.1 BatD family protein [Paracrocinitomix mangrovi]
MIKHFYILLLLLSNFVFAQSESIQVAVSGNTVTNNDIFQYQISVGCKCDLNPPAFIDFDVLGQNEGSMQSTTIINGKQTNTCTRTITYNLRAKKKGTLSIESASANCDGEKSKADGIQINVVDAEEAFNASKGVAPYFYEVKSSKDEVFVGEPFTITFSLYTDKNVSEIVNLMKGDAIALWRQPLFDERDPQHVFEQYHTKVKGKDYSVIVLTQELCFADQAGTIHISPYYGNAVESYDIFNTRYREGYSNSLDIKVKEVPVSKPENYNGMAGKFEITHSISDTDVKVGHAFDMKIKVSGLGNFNILKAPEPDYFFSADTFLCALDSINDQLAITEKGLDGWIEFSYVITPKVAGNYHVKPFAFSYYDWDSRSMKSVTTHEFDLKIKEGKAPKIENPNGEVEVQEVEQDIHHISTGETTVFDNSDFIFGRWYYWLLVLGPFAVPFFLIIVSRKKSKVSDEELIKSEQKNTKKTVIKEIPKLKTLDNKEGLRQLKNLIEEYFMKHLQIGRSALSKSSITQNLKSQNVDDSHISSFQNIWDQLEIAQYAPLSDKNTTEIFDETAELIKNLNKLI